MSEFTLTQLKAQRDAIDEQIANHAPLARNDAIGKVRAYATEHGMTKADLFPTPISTDTDYEHEPEPEPEFEQTPFSRFKFPDSFGYTFIAALKEQRDQLDSEIAGVLAAIQREAIERARAFIREYNLTKADIYPTSSHAK